MEAQSRGSAAGVWGGGGAEEEEERRSRGAVRCGKRMAPDELITLVEA